MYYLLNYKCKGFDKYWRRFMMNFSGDALHLLQTRENYVLIYMYTLFASCSTGAWVNKMTHGGGVLTGALN